MTSYIPVQNLKNRRLKLFDLIDPGSLVIIDANSMQNRGSNGEYQFYQNSSFWYFTGIDAPNCTLIIYKEMHTEKVQEVLFVPRVTEFTKKWVSHWVSCDTVLETSGIPNVKDISELDTFIQKHTPLCSHIFLDMHTFEEVLYTKHIISSGASIQSYDALIGEMRCVKDLFEKEMLETACKVSIEAHTNALKALVTKQNQLSEFTFSNHFIAYGVLNGCTMSYTPIVASGSNATVLHYTKNNQEINSNLLLVDAGLQHNYYCSDITRTYPLSGRFSQAEKEVYEIVLDAHESCLQGIKDGRIANLWEMELCARKVLIKGLISLGVCDGNYDEVYGSMEWKKWYPHSIGHWLGLDTHDLGFKREIAHINGKIGKIHSRKPFQKGVVCTLEPGLYFDIDDLKVPERYRGIGIRIENDIYIDEKDGMILPIVLTKELPYHTKEVEDFVLKIRKENDNQV